MSQLPHESREVLSPPFEPPPYTISFAEDGTLQWDPPIGSPDLALALSYHFPLQKTLEEKMQVATGKWLKQQRKARPSSGVGGLQALAKEPKSAGKEIKWVLNPSENRTRELKPAVIGLASNKTPLASSLVAHKRATQQAKSSTKASSLETTTRPETFGMTSWRLQGGGFALGRRRKRAYTEKERREVGKNRGMVCEFHKAKKLKCDPNTCPHNKLRAETKAKKENTDTKPSESTAFVASAQYWPDFSSNTFTSFVTTDIGDQDLLRRSIEGSSPAANISGNFSSQSPQSSHQGIHNTSSQSANTSLSPNPHTELSSQDGHSPGTVDSSNTMPTVNSTLSEPQDFWSPTDLSPIFSKRDLPHFDTAIPTSNSRGLEDVHMDLGVSESVNNVDIPLFGDQWENYNPLADFDMPLSPSLYNGANAWDFDYSADTLASTDGFAMGGVYDSWENTVQAPSSSFSRARSGGVVEVGSGDMYTAISNQPPAMAAPPPVVPVSSRLTQPFQAPDLDSYGSISSGSMSFGAMHVAGKESTSMLNKQELMRAKNFEVVEHILPVQRKSLRSRAPALASPSIGSMHVAEPAKMRTGETGSTSKIFEQQAMVSPPQRGGWRTLPSDSRVVDSESRTKTVPSQPGAAVLQDIGESLLSTPPPGGGYAVPQSCEDQNETIGVAVQSARRARGSLFGSLKSSFSRESSGIKRHENAAASATAQTYSSPTLSSENRLAQKKSDEAPKEKGKKSKKSSPKSDQPSAIQLPSSPKDTTRIDKLSTPKSAPPPRVDEYFKRSTLSSPKSLSEHSDVLSPLYSSTPRLPASESRSSATSHPAAKYSSPELRFAGHTFHDSFSEQPFKKLSFAPSPANPSTSKALVEEKVQIPQQVHTQDGVTGQRKAGAVSSPSVWGGSVAPLPLSGAPQARRTSPNFLSADTASQLLERNSQPKEPGQVKQNKERIITGQSTYAQEGVPRTNIRQRTSESMLPPPNIASFQHITRYPLPEADQDELDNAGELLRERDRDRDRRPPNPPGGLKGFRVRAIGSLFEKKKKVSNNTGVSGSLPGSPDRLQISSLMGPVTAVAKKPPTTQPIESQPAKKLIDQDLSLDIGLDLKAVQERANASIVFDGLRIEPGLKTGVPDTDSEEDDKECEIDVENQLLMATGVGQKRQRKLEIQEASSVKDNIPGSSRVAIHTDNEEDGETSGKTDEEIKGVVQEEDSKAVKARIDPQIDKFSALEAKEEELGSLLAGLGALDLEELGGHSVK